MKVSELMKHEACRTHPEASLREAGQIMAEVGCGFLPVVDPDQKVVGVITDRDLAVALVTADQKPSEVAVANAMSHDICATHAEDDLSTALSIMAAHRVRRLPVLDEQGRLDGILSLDDVVLSAGLPGSVQASSTRPEEILVAMRAICNHPVLALEVAR